MSWVGGVKGRLLDCLPDIRLTGLWRLSSLESLLAHVCFFIFKLTESWLPSGIGLSVEGSLAICLLGQVTVYNNDKFHDKFGFCILT